MRGAVRGLLLLLALAGFVLFASLNFELRFEDAAGVGRRTERHSLGLWFSPWFEYVRVYEHAELPNGGLRVSHTGYTQVLWLSWSWPLGIAAAWCLTVAWRMSPPKSSEADVSAAPKPARRTLTFATLDEAVADAENLLAKGYEKAGNWDLSQVCFHLAEWMRYPVEGFPRMPLLLRPVLWLMRNTVAGPALRNAIAKGQMPTGQPTLAPSVAPPGGDPAAAVAKLKESVGRFQAYRGPYQPSPLLGVLEADTALKTQLLHCAHHLSFLVPK